jgi:hypothetical protein
MKATITFFACCVIFFCSAQQKKYANGLLLTNGYDTVCLAFKDSLPVSFFRGNAIYVLGGLGYVKSAQPKVSVRAVRAVGVPLRMVVNTYKGYWRADFSTILETAAFWSCWVSKEHMSAMLKSEPVMLGIFLFGKNGKQSKTGCYYIKLQY